MRLDKFLKVSRLIKRRTLAKEVADQGRITINGKVAKASSAVKAGDELAIRFGQKIVTARVEELRDTVKKEDAAKMFTILKEERLEKIEPEYIDDED
ncbi:MULTISPECIES: RNA-binding S4 domain-containing protein [unclassified Lysinibacillus]|uniref:RNA-binding S4 domain-containing protein n=1 Tax=unclassified Lysinibacillus TaxID=2636778 RepID=UPI0025551094|nr:MULTISPECIES: RNA-binding S4 domain-containing protein [unclassified Lysinibacillus]MDM5245855.1 RNA-binding S4 domain-containing protein [Lysinibacillus sp. G4S2]